jgi:hypothetical protein
VSYNSSGSDLIIISFSFLPATAGLVSDAKLEGVDLGDDVVDLREPDGREVDEEAAPEDVVQKLLSADDVRVGLVRVVPAQRQLQVEVEGRVAREINAVSV